MARDPREISGSTNMGTRTINNCSLAAGRRFIRAQARTCGFGPDRGMETWLRFRCRRTSFVYLCREWSMVVVCPIGEKKRGLEGFRSNSKWGSMWRKSFSFFSFFLFYFFFFFFGTRRQRKMRLRLIITDWSYPLEWSESWKRPVGTKFCKKESNKAQWKSSLPIVQRLVSASLSKSSRNGIDRFE